MAFIDSINIYVASGRGGDGSVSFLNSFSKSFKKPDGGNGGKGGDVYFICDKNVTTFNCLRSNINYKAGDGKNGESSRKTGKNGNNLFIRVPIGTLIYDNERFVLLSELINDGDYFLILKGGRAGYGNCYLDYSNKNFLRKLLFGAKGKILQIHLELKLLSDVGLLGFPNVGKSSFVNKISNVNSKIGNYDFTTLTPILGMINLNYFNHIVISDLPGIIKGAHNGSGLGYNFLKHILKTKLLLHFIDLSSIKSSFSFLRHLHIINNELIKYNLNLNKIEKWVIFNKIDLYDFNMFNCFNRKIFNKFNYTNIFYISVRNDIGLKKLSFNICEFFSSFNFTEI